MKEIASSNNEKDLQCYEKFSEIDNELSKETIHIEVIFDQKRTINFSVIGDTRKEYVCLLRIKSVVSQQTLKVILKPNYWISAGFECHENLNEKLSEIEFEILLRKFRNE